MEVRICGSCGLSNESSKWHCILCGSTLSIDSITTREEYEPELITLVGEYKVEQGENSRETKVKRIAERCSHLLDSIYVLNWISKYDASDLVARTAKSALERHPLRNKLSLDIDEPSFDQPNDQDLFTSPQDPDIEIAKNSNKLAAGITLVSRVLDIIAELMIGEFGVDTIAMTFAGVILAIGLLTYQRWAVVVTLIGALLGALLFTLGAFIDNDLPTALVTSSIYFGYAASMVVLLWFKPKKRNAIIGVVVFALFYLIPVCLSFGIVAIGRAIGEYP